MAARNKPPSRINDRVAGSRTPDVDEISGTHLRASQHREELLEEARALRAAGRIREARGVEKRAAQVDQLLGALEADVKRPNPHA
jgi:hypothetical protein